MTKRKGWKEYSLKNVRSANRTSLVPSMTPDMGKSKTLEKLKNEAREKELALMNRIAPLSVGERHYPKEFTIKPTGEEE